MYSSSGLTVNSSWTTPVSMSVFSLTISKDTTIQAVLPTCVPKTSTTKSSSKKKVTGSQPLPFKKRRKMNACISHDYAFVPAYGEWHLIDTNKPQEVLFNVVDPLERLYIHLDPFDEHSEVDPLEKATYEDVLDFSEDCINVARRCAENNEDFDGIVYDDETVPGKAAEIIAQALYNYYIA